MDRITTKLSGDPTAIVLTILSLIIIFLGCCCGVFAFVSLILSIIGLIVANKSIRAYALDPEAYDFKSYKAMNTARILGIVGIALSALIVIAQVSFLLTEGKQISEDFWKQFQKGKNGNYEWKWEYNSDQESDSTYTLSNDDNTIILKKQGDSIVIDSSAIDTQQ